MFKNISTKFKLMVFPFTFVFIVIVSGIVFSYYDNIVAKTHDMAVDTDKILKLVVSNADEKEFKGKDDLKAKNITKKDTQEKINISKQTKSNTEDKEWESF